MARIMASLTDVHAKGKILALFLKRDYLGHKARENEIPHGLLA